MTSPITLVILTTCIILLIPIIGLIIATWGIRKNRKKTGK